MPVDYDHKRERAPALGAYEIGLGFAESRGIKEVGNLSAMGLGEIVH